MIGFALPHLLALLVLVPLLRRRPVRAAMAALAVLAAAGPYYERPSKGSDCIILVDRSASCAPAAERALREIRALLRRADGPDDRTAVVGFGDGARVEEGFDGATAAPEPPGFAHRSDLAAALELASGLRDPRRRTVILCLSDGLADAAPASSPGAPFRYRLVGGRDGPDAAARDIVLPARVQPRSAWPVRFAVAAARPGPARLVLRRNGAVILDVVRPLRRGENAFALRDAAPDADVLDYRLEVTMDGDTVPQNDRARGLVLAARPPRVLLVTRRHDDGWLGGVLRAAAIPFDRVLPGDFPTEPVRLAAYRTVVVEHCAAHDFPAGRLDSLAALVRAGLTSVLLTGGPDGFAAGGYRGSPLEPLLPVDLERQRDLRRSGVALALALDRSGSMAAPVGGDRVKMDLANLGAAEAVRLLGAGDEIAILAVDSAAHTVVPLSRADAPDETAALALGIEPMGGGIFTRTALEAAAAEVRRSGLRQRHILLFADASDAEEQDGAEELAAQLAEEGIGVSVVALGRETDADAAFLRRLAAAGRGTAVFAAEAAGLPALFAAEVVRLAERGFIDEPATPVPLPPLASLVPGAPPLPQLGGYNVAAAREDAVVAWRLDDEFHTPLVAFRRVGAASTAALLFEVEGEFAGGFPRWPAAAELTAALVRRITPDAAPDGMKMYTHKRAAAAVARVEVSPDAAARLRAARPVFRWIGPEGGTVETALEWTAPFALETTLPLTTPGAFLPVADLGGPVSGPAVALSYSPEFAPARPGEGRRILARLAAVAGGGEAGDVTRIREDAVADSRERAALTMPALLALLGLFLLDVGERRGLLSLAKR